MNNDIANSVKNMLRYVWIRSGLRQFYLQNNLSSDVAKWRRIRSDLTNTETSNSILIIPSDPHLLTSSVGDQAMIGAIINFWLPKFPTSDLYIATSSNVADEAVKLLNAKPLRILGDDFNVLNVRDIFSKYRFRLAILMGADGLDGSYDPLFSGRQLILLDLAARMGSETYITGFSVSLKFNRIVTKIFEELERSVRINIRDPLSFSRFSSIVTREAHQVADIAFLLKGLESSRMLPILQWIELQKYNKRKVVVINFHPLLLDPEVRHKFPLLIERLSETFLRLSEMEPVSYLAISHDDRGASADKHGLEPLCKLLEPQLGNNLLYIREQLTAVEIKELVKKVDSVITGRMHLMIASIGSGTPVFGIDYKDKMEGLLLFSGLNKNNITNAASILNSSEKFAFQLESFLQGLNYERDIISERRIHIENLALNNFNRT